MQVCSGPCRQPRYESCCTDKPECKGNTMELRYSVTSPYVRKVMVTAIELGIEAQISLNTTSPYETDTNLREFNPLSKIPCLVTDEGLALFDSPVICEYLCGQAGNESIFPPIGDARWAALRDQAIADGILDASLVRRYELLREPEMRSASWDARQKLAMDGGLNTLDRECNSWNTDITIGRITTGCMLGFLDLRFADEDWRSGRPSLAAWYDFFSERESMQRTVPVAS